MNREAFLSNFDFRSYVHSKFDTIIETSLEDRVRVLCPFCGDKSGHLYILLSEGLPYCQRCKYNPRSPIKFISDIENIPVRDVIEWVDSDFDGSGSRVMVSEVIENLFSIVEDLEFEYDVMELEDCFVPVLNKTGVPIIDKRVLDALTYLYSRGFNNSDIEKFDMRFAYDGKYSGRVIVPCRYRGDIVSFVARDVFDSSDRKYLNPIGNKQSDFLFNYDYIESNCVVLTEGVFDAVRISSDFPAVASFGKSLSSRQIKLLDEFKLVIFYWDLDAYEQAHGYASKLSVECKTILHPDDKDAGSRSRVENARLIKGAVPFDSIAYEVYKMDLPIDRRIVRGLQS